MGRWRYTQFVARVLIDLVFISALIQAVLISVNLSRHKRRFLKNQDVHVLDDRIEKTELSRLARRKNGQWTFKEEIELYKHYDDHRLAKLRMGATTGTRLHATLLKLFELKQLVYLPPGEQLVDFARQNPVDPEAIHAALNLMQEEPLDLEYLALARALLNSKGGLEEVRTRVMHLITKVPTSPERDAKLLEVIKGSDADTLAPVRIMAVEALSRVARRNANIISALHLTAKKDRAERVRRKAAHEIKARRLVLQPIAPKKKDKG